MAAAERLLPDPEANSEEMQRLSHRMLETTMATAARCDIDYGTMLWAHLNCAANLCLQFGPPGRELEVLDEAIEAMKLARENAPEILKIIEGERQQEAAAVQGHEPGHA